VAQVVKTVGKLDDDYRMSSAMDRKHFPVCFGLTFLTGFHLGTAGFS